MNSIKHLTGFYDKAISDNIHPTHISLYMVLFQYWSMQRYNNTVCVKRQDLMRLSKIKSKVTYHKCIKELNDRGYLKYEPSYNPFGGSSVTLYNLGLKNSKKPD
jgi:hypothetical protein